MGSIVIWQPCDGAAGQQTGAAGPPLPQPLPPGFPPLPVPPLVPDPLPLPPPELAIPDLAILKTANGPCAPAGGGAFACSYTVSVTNVSTVPYLGSIQVDDATSFALGQLSTTSSPPWACLGTGTANLLCDFPPVTLLPGVSIPLLITETIPAGALTGAPCQVANTATITDAPGGDFNPANNTSTASATLPTANCVPVPPPTTLGSNLSIQKKGDICSKTTFGFDCHFTVTVTNSGTTTFTGPLQVNDATGAPPSVPVVFTGPFTCTGTTNAQCKIASQTLLPGASVSFGELVPVITPLLPQTACNLPNTAQIAAPAPGSPTNTNPADDSASAVGVINDPACLKNPPPPPVPQPVSNLKISKIGDPCTKTGVDFTCNFVVTIANTTNAGFNGPVSFDDTVALGTLTTTAPGWSCGAANPHPCSHPANLSIPANSSVALNMTVTFPGSAITFCREDNTVHITTPVGGSTANNDPSDDTATASSNVVSPICSPNPKPPLLQSNIRLDKTATPDCTKLGNGNFLCSYALTLTNTGPGPCCDSLTVQDQMSQDFLKATFSGTLAGVTCLTAPPPTTVAQCSTPNPLNLPVGVPVTLTNVAFEVPAADATPGKCKFDNFALVQTPQGGTAANSNTGDDLSAATAKIPIVIDPQNGAVPCDPPSLKLSKVATSPLCAKTAAGFDCTYAISIESTGPDPFHGPLVLNEKTPAGATLKSNSANWVCNGSAPAFQCVHGFTTIPVGKTETLNVTVSVPDASTKPGACLVPNQVQMAFTDGPLKGKTYSASAAARIDDPRCQRTGTEPPAGTTPPAPQGDGHASIVKTCSPSAAGGAVSCRITLTNDGGKPIASAISFGDQGQWTGNGSPMHVLAATPDSSAISCGGLPDALTCSIDGKSLPPGASHSVLITLASAGDQVRYKNCARILTVDRTPLPGPGHESCVEGGGEITVTKTGPASCVPGQPCVFQVTIANAGNASFTGPVLVGDALLTGGAVLQGAQITVSPPFGCAPEPTTLPFNCVTNASLGGHEQQTHTVTVRLPAVNPAGATNGLNCFFATDGGKGAGGPANASIAGITPHAGNGPGYSCVPFTVQPVGQTCPGDLVRIGTQCKCPEGSTQGRNYTCVGGGVHLVPLPLPLPTTPVCEDRERRMPNGECCPRGTTWNGETCGRPYTPPPPPARCPDGSLKSVNPNCYTPPATCPDGSLKSRNPNCYTPPKTCADGSRLSDNPHCCPRGTQWNGEICASPHQPCPAGTTGPYQPNCQVIRQPCPEGTIGRYQPFCQQVPQRLPCPAGTTGPYQPNCQVIRQPCPEGTIGRYQPFCQKAPQRLPCPAGTTGPYQPNCQVIRQPCPEGTIGRYQPFCQKAPQRLPCPQGTTGPYQPNCQPIAVTPPAPGPCPPGMIRIGGRCRIFNFPKPQGPIQIGPSPQPTGPVVR